MDVAAGSTAGCEYCACGAGAANEAAGNVAALNVLTGAALPVARLRQTVARSGHGHEGCRAR
eukprot:CAMPEP_0194479432 /NCGR_PEP_ID=MMETSP0253-20130528/2558_1 /TAXON_ID=2966 /ORGANISM="Noctiluca scintillans" /LENGTH=61 /DNA_ID=CAMNT_0039318657 /DNA_START=9 /DNA_END=190 /DNA_ORIENTATION=-